LLALDQSLFSYLPVRVVTAVPLAYEFTDSTNALWLIGTDEPRVLFLKLLARDTTPFWQVMDALFDVRPRDQYGHYADLYERIALMTPLSIPNLRYCSSQTADHAAYVLTDMLFGEPIHAEQVTENMVIRLAQHLVALHRNAQSTWGSLLNGQGAASDWAFAVRETLSYVFPNDDSIRGFNHFPSVFVPMMPDLRWDQFLVSNGQLSALVDLDAFVFAPIELDFVLLEYLMSGEQLAIWLDAYERAGGVLPDIGAVREVYRKLLFAMNVLGENDLSCWLACPSYFDLLVK